MSTVSTKEVQLLMEAGFLAANGGMIEQAQKIFEGVQAVRPGSEFAHIGRAVTQMAANNMDEAAKILREDALKANPDNLQAKMFLALVLKLANRGGECDQVIEQLQKSEDAAAQEFASSLMA